MGKTSVEAKERYNKKVYEDIRLRVKVGKKEIIQSHAEQQGESLNAFINHAIDDRIAKESQDESGRK